MSAPSRMDAPAVERGIAFGGYLMLAGLATLVQLWLAGTLLGIGLDEALNRAGQGLVAALHVIPSWFW